LHHTTTTTTTTTTTSSSSSSSLLLLGFTKCGNQQAPAKNLAKDKSFQAQKHRVSFTNPSILSCGWVDATVAAYLGSGWVGGFFS
jgi:hypothetical protein